MLTWGHLAGSSSSGVTRPNDHDRDLDIKDVMAAGTAAETETTTRDDKQVDVKSTHTGSDAGLSKPYSDETAKSTTASSARHASFGAYRDNVNDNDEQVDDLEPSTQHAKAMVEGKIDDDDNNDVKLKEKTASHEEAAKEEEELSMVASVSAIGSKLMHAIIG